MLCWWASSTVIVPYGRHDGAPPWTTNETLAVGGSRWDAMTVARKTATEYPPLPERRWTDLVEGELAAPKALTPPLLPGFPLALSELFGD